MTSAAGGDGLRFFHIDFDAFYASIEQRDDPQLAGKPVIVGAMPGKRGVVAACSYEARACGVHSAMPSGEAHRLCPNGVFLPPRMNVYAEESLRLMELLGRFSPDVQQVSIDEAFLGISGLQRIWGPPAELAARIRRATHAERGLRVSVGAARSRYFAKLASARCKPDGSLLLKPGGERGFLASLQLADLWGVGASTLARLQERGIHEVSQLLDLDRTTCEAMLGEGASRYLSTVTAGNDPGIFTARRRSRSVSSETTFGKDTADRRSLERALLGLCHRVGDRLAEQGVESRTLVLKVRTAAFHTRTVRRSSDRAFGSAADAFRVARELLDQRWDGRTPLRLLGVGFVDVRPIEPGQGDLFDDRARRVRTVERTVARLAKSKSAPLLKASLLATRGGKASSTAADRAAPFDRGKERDRR